MLFQALSVAVFVCFMPGLHADSWQDMHRTGTIRADRACCVRNGEIFVFWGIVRH